MSYVARLELDINNPPTWAVLDSQAADLGHPFRVHKNSAGVEGIPAFLADAKGLWIDSPTFLGSDQIESQIHAAIALGKRAVVRVSVNFLDKINRFLDRYGIEGTTIAAHANDKSTGYPRLIRLDRATHPNCFNAPDLLDGVSDVLFQQPQVLKVDDRSMAVLTLPLDAVSLTDLQTDYFTNWWTSKVPIIALSEPVESGSGAVLAYTASFLHDPYVGPTGVRFPGVTYGDNKTLSLRILEWLIQIELPGDPHAAEAFRVLELIERLLIRVMCRTLEKQVGKDWWERVVPPRIRIQAEATCEREGRLFEPACYLRLSDIKVILETNWALFERSFRQPGLADSLADLSALFGRLFPIRNRVMHPLKRELSRVGISIDELEFLNQLRSKLRQLDSAAQ